MRPQCPPPVPEMRAQLRDLRGGPHVPEDLRPGPRSHGVKRLSQATRARVQGPSCSPSSPLLPGPESKAPPFHQLSRMTCSLVRGTTVPPGVPGDLVQGPRAHVFYFLPRTTRVRVQGPPGSTTPSGRHEPMSEGLWPRPHNPGYPRPVTSAHGIDQLCLETRARERRPLVLTSFAR